MHKHDVYSNFQTKNYSKLVPKKMYKSLLPTGI